MAERCARLYSTVLTPDALCHHHRCRGQPPDDFRTSHRESPPLPVGCGGNSPDDSTYILHCPETGRESGICLYGSPLRLHGSFHGAAVHHTPHDKVVINRIFQECNHTMRIGLSGLADTASAIATAVAGKHCFFSDSLFRLPAECYVLCLYHWP